MSRDAVPGIDRPLTLLIAALGGEGGGVLADWVVAAAASEGVMVQSTSIPGVAQRTGATTYYLEMMKTEDGGREPVFALYPAPGNVDVVAASELIEAGRAIENGFVTPERTHLIASTHRVYAMAEKTAAGTGAFDDDRVRAAAEKLARRTVLTDFSATAQHHGVALNALLLGAIAATGLCPVPAEAFRRAIRERGVAVDSNLAGFEVGMALEDEGVASGDVQRDAGGAVAAVADDLPAEVAEIAAEGVRRLTDYQDAAYAGLYVERLRRVLAAERAHGTAAPVSRLTARYLALWMAYEDVIRVADLKSRAGRFARVRQETGAKAGEPVRVTEFLKPGIEELATVLPAGLGRRLTAWAERRGLTEKLHLPMHVRSDTITGYLRLRLVASLRRLRRQGLRHAEEQALIERWLDAVVRATAVGREAGCELAEAGRLVKGYSDTRKRAFAKLETLLDRAVPHALAAREADEAAAILRASNEAALADEEGTALDALLAGMEGLPAEAETVRGMAAAE